MTLLDRGLTRILYVDIDAHHGDGVEMAFANDNRVSTLSIHEEDRWPHSGQLEACETGQVNIPVPQGLNDSEFKYIFEEFVLPYCGHFYPDAIVITCGADGLKDDPLSKMNLSNVMLWDAVERLRDQSPTCVVLGGGGYNPWTTIRCWVGLWGRLAGFTMPIILPDEAQSILSKFDSDLIDEEDRDPNWLTTLADNPNFGEVRTEVVTRVEQLVQILKSSKQKVVNFE
jgi:acetoin utilization protein AcuC